jgi:ubiquinone/menaquinone biosynthesis C-methylase UbiE
MYRERGHDYEDSWHPDYTRRFMDLVGVRPGDRVLDLACGTGLDAILAAEQAGDDGYVVGVDATPEMLEVARRKLEVNTVIARRLKLIQHNVCDLATCPEIPKDSFDLIICSNAFVLFDEPAKVVAHWRDYLKPGGRMAIDVTHEHNLRPALLLELAAQRLKIPFPFHRLWIKSKDSFRELLENQGLVVEKSTALTKEKKGTFFLEISQAQQEFDRLISTPMVTPIVTDEFNAKVWPLFHEEWMAAAVDGKLEVVDQLYAYVARRV